MKKRAFQQVCHRLRYKLSQKQAQISQDSRSLATGAAAATVAAHLLHRVVHGKQRLHPPALQHVGELHVDGLHGPRVAQDPVLVWVWGVVVAWSSERGGGEKRIKERLQPAVTPLNA